MARSEPSPPEPGPPGASGAPGLPRRTLLTFVGGLIVVGGAATEALAGQVVRPVVETDQLPGPPQPTIRDCHAWGARDPSGNLTVIAGRPKYILIHHTATENRDNVGSDDLNELAKAIQDFHMDTNGWVDSGHQFLVNRGGLIAEGRHRSLETLRGGRSFIEGSQCTDHNDDSIGIENQGTYSEADPPPAMLTSLRALLAFACVRYRVSPAHLYGHRDFSDTVCPGDRLYAMLPALRSQVGRLLGRGGPSRVDDPNGSEGPSQVDDPLSWPLLRIADRGPRVLAAQHLLRAAGVPGVPADGAFGRSTADGVSEFQRRHGTEQTGMIGGGSWPKLMAAARPGSGGEVDAAVQALMAGSAVRPGQRFDLPATLNARTWQRLLAAARAS